jgi:flagellar hook-associated protein 1
MSTFRGLEVAKRTLHAQQSAINTTGHNIANANTPGYSRQRVNFEQVNA